MKRIIIITVLVVAITGIASYFYYTRSSDTPSFPPGISKEQIEKHQKQAEDFDKQFQNPDGTVNNAATAEYLEKEISKAEAAVKATASGTLEREKAERRVKMLMKMKGTMK